MGIFDIIRKTRDKDNKTDVVDKPEQKIEDKQEFVSDLSYLELQNADWVSFAGILKREGVLSNSYDKKPASIEYSFRKDNSPMVELIFKSKTSDSVRKVQLMNGKAYLFINGATENFPETQRNKTLNKIWEEFQEELRYRNMISTNQDGHFHRMEAERMIKKAKKMKELDNIYGLEQVFLETYKDARFDDFCHTFINDEYSLIYSNYFPAFIPLLKEPVNGKFHGTPVVPFSPRTLEFCILHMTDGEMIDHGEYIGDFEAMCRKIQEYSCYESEDWDKVIEMGKNIIRQKYAASMMSNGFNM